ncbi:hypothetical protein JCM3775_000612 [Rhodotorula graminis]
MAAQDPPGDGDPFPLLHLADLDFAFAASTLADLAAYQLALAPWSTSWDDSLAAALKRTWRRRREKARPLITAREPMGIHAPLDLQQRDQFPRFECVDLAFDLDPASVNLDHLSSAQLAAVQFHPAATAELVMAAEDAFFTRRERDFAAGLSLPPFPPSASTSSTPAAPAPVAAAPSPTPLASAPSSTTAVPPAAADSTLPSLPARAPTTSRLPPRPVAPPSIPPTSFTPPGAPPRAAAASAPLDPSLVRAAAGSSSASSASTTSRLPALAKPPALAPPVVAQPQPSSAASASASSPASRAPTTAANVASARDGPARAGERERVRDDEPRRDRARSRSRDRDYDAARSRDRASSSRRSERERGRERSLSPGTAQRERERAAYKEAKAAREREDEERERERERGGRRRRSRDEEGEEGRRARERSSGRSSRERETSRMVERGCDERDERERASGSKPSSSRAYSRARSRSRSRSPATRRDSGHESSFVALGSASRKRAVSPARSDYSHASSTVLRSSTRRRLDDADYASTPARVATPPTGPRRQTPPPSMPRPSESVPIELLSRLHTVFLRHLPGRLSATDIAEFVRHGAPTTRADPIAIKCHSRPNQDFGQAGEAGLEPDVTLAFVMYDEGDVESARELIRCTDHARFRGRKITSSVGAEQTTSSWRWSDFKPSFVDAHHRQQLAAHAARQAPSTYAHASSASSSSSVLANRIAPPHLQPVVDDRAPPPHLAGVPHAAPSAGPSADGGGAGRRASTAAPLPPHTPLPSHLLAALSTLYVSNVAADTTLGECRDFFDPCVGLVGLSLSEVSSSLRALRFRDAWLAFETQRERDRARHELMGGKYPGAAVKLWVELAEMRARNQGEEHEWLRSEMSKDYRSMHLSDYEAACRGNTGDAAGDGVSARSDYSASNPPTPRHQQQQQQPQASPTVDPRRRPSQQHTGTEPPTAPAALRFFPAGQPRPPSGMLDPFMSASSSSSISSGPAGPPSRLAALAQGAPPLDAYSPLAPILPFSTFSTSHSPHPHAYTAPYPQQQQQSSSAPPSRPSTGVPRPGPQTVPGTGSSVHPTDSALMRPPSAPAAAPSAPRGTGFMDPARAALLASSGAAGAGGLVDEPMQLDGDDDERGGGGERRPTAAEEKARAEEAARSAWGARRGGAAAVGAQVQPDGAQPQENGQQGQQDDAGRPRAFSLGIKGRAGSSSGGTSAGTRSPAAPPSTSLDVAPVPAPSAVALAADAPATDTPAADAEAANMAPGISPSALEALGAALKLQGLPGMGDGASNGVEEGSGEAP